MPIFEYKCNDCNNNFEFLHMGRENINGLKCPECSSGNYRKLLSVFSSSQEKGISENVSSDTPQSANSCCMGGSCFS